MSFFGVLITKLGRLFYQKRQDVIEKAKEDFAHFQNVAKLRSLTTEEIVDYTRAIKVLNDYKED